MSCLAGRFFIAEPPQKSRLGFVAVHSLSHVQFFATPWMGARQASLSFTISQSLLKFMSTQSVMPSKHLILCRPLLLLPSVLPSIRVFSNESHHGELSPVPLPPVSCFFLTVTSLG